MKKKGEKMRVVQINTVKSGCTGRIAMSLKCLLDTHGDQCVMAYGRGDMPQKNEYKISSKFDSNIHGFFTRIFDTSGLHSIGKTKKFIDFLNIYKPHIIHIHNLHGYYINYPLLFDYIKQNNIKVVWTLHDCWPFTGHCPYYSYVGCDKWMLECNHCQQKYHHPTSYIFDRSRKNYYDKMHAFNGVKNMTIVTPSVWLKKEVEKSILKGYNIIHIPNGISLNEFHPTQNIFRTKYGLESNIIILGVANLWAKTKGMNYFLELSKYLKSNYKIVLVGLSKKQKQNLPNNIIGIEKTENIAELVDIYSSADIFLNPTLEDNFPTTNIEALACGTPVITFNTGGSPEAIDCKCGIVVEKNIKDILESCVSFGKKNQMRIDNCLQRAKLFDENICFGRYIDLYER